MDDHKTWHSSQKKWENATLAMCLIAYVAVVPTLLAIGRYQREIRNFLVQWLPFLAKIQIPRLTPNNSAQGADRALDVNPSFKTPETVPVAAVRQSEVISQKTDTTKSANGSDMITPVKLEPGGLTAANGQPPDKEAHHNGEQAATTNRNGWGNVKKRSRFAAFWPLFNPSLRPEQAGDV